MNIEILRFLLIAIPIITFFNFISLPLQLLTNNGLLVSYARCWMCAISIAGSWPSWPSRLIKSTMQLYNPNRLY